MLSYDRSTPPELHGSQELSYYIGSNTRGRTFLFSVDGFLYQAPINYYVGKRAWDMAPGDAQLHEMQLNHPVDDTCLFCHTSRVQPRELALSACRQQSNGALTCTSCHDPHVKVSASERSEFYRSKCLTCHSTLAESHHTENHDCTSCHMPRLSSADIGHTMVTDHRILRNPKPQPTGAPPPLTRIVQFNNPSPSTRELGLAYGEVALTGNESAASEASRLLQQSLQTGQDDADVLVRLAYLQQMRGNLDEAQRLYGRALARDPGRPVAAANLGVLEARHGQLAAALSLWRTAFDKNPQLTPLGIDLARGLWESGNGNEARAVARPALRHNPDSSATRQLVSELATSGCVKR